MKRTSIALQGFEKPIYAIPGNHDWFDADEGFTANFFDHDQPSLRLLHDSPRT
jgi:DNA repair exonuclease SbcCD nuclease subunit